MDRQYWIYLVVAIIYLIRWAMKKSESQPKQPTNSEPARPVQHNQSPLPNSPKTLTFEELLREITESKQPKPAYQPARPKTEYVDYDDVIEKEERSLEDVNYDYRKQDTIYATYEDAKRQAFERPSLEETMKISDTKMQFGKFKVFEKENQRDMLEEYTKGFQDPEGFKKAFVMSEILNRKF